MLEVDFCGELHNLGDAEELLFGRAGDLVIDDANPYMHRMVGRFRHDGGVWWVDNLGTAIELTLSASSGTRILLSPAKRGVIRSAAVVEPKSSLTFRAGTTNYRLDLTAEVTCPSPAVDAVAPGESTVGHGQVRLTEDERLLLAALAQPRLLDPLAGPTSLPANGEVAAQFGWKITTYNRKLDRLCQRLGKAGVPGLQGSRGAEAANRRWVLVDHAVSHGLVSTADL